MINLVCAGVPLQGLRRCLLWLIKSSGEKCPETSRSYGANVEPDPRFSSIHYEGKDTTTVRRIISGNSQFIY